jgi:hypothetical protein
MREKQLARPINKSKNATPSATTPKLGDPKQRIKISEVQAKQLK